MEARSQAERDHVLRFKPWETIQWFRHRVTPGVDAVDDSNLRRYRQMLAFGKVLAALAAAAGVIMAGIGQPGWPARLAGRRAPKNFSGLASKALDTIRRQS